MLYVDIQSIFKSKIKSIHIKYYVVVTVSYRVGCMRPGYQNFKFLFLDMALKACLCFNKT